MELRISEASKSAKALSLKAKADNYLAAWERSLTTLVKAETKIELEYLQQVADGQKALHTIYEGRYHDHLAAVCAFR